MWLSIAGAAGATALSMSSSRKSSQLMQTEMENRKLSERNSATEQTMMRTEQMAKAASSQAVAAAAYGSLGSSTYRNSIAAESHDAYQDIHAIETNAKVKELGMDARIADSKSSQKMNELGSLLSLSKNMFDTVNFYDMSGGFDSFKKLPSPF